MYLLWQIISNIWQYNCTLLSSTKYWVYSSPSFHPHLYSQQLHQLPKAKTQFTYQFAFNPFQLVFLVYRLVTFLHRRLRAPWRDLCLCCSCWVCARQHHAWCVGLDSSSDRFICSACQQRTKEKTIAGQSKMGFDISQFFSNSDWI